MVQFPNTTSASGVWNMTDVYNNRLGGTWPAGAIGLLGGGTSPGYGNSINKITLLSTGNAIDFGDLSLSTAQSGFGQMASTTRGFLISGAETSPVAAYNNTIEFSTFTTSGSATDFGDLSTRAQSVGTLSNSTRGVMAGGFTPSPNETTAIQFITLATNGDTTNFGTLTQARGGLTGLASSTRGVFSGGFVSPSTMINTVDYITIATTGNGTDFGDLLSASRGGGAGGNSTRGIYGGGQLGSPFASTNVIQYITIATTGDYQDFGDLITARNYLAGLSASPILAFAGGSGPTNLIDFVTINSLGNATDFGDLAEARSVFSGTSNNHGGLS